MFNQSTKFWIDYINQAEQNSPPFIGQKNRLIKNIYNSFNLFSSYDQTSSTNIFIQNRHQANHGSITDICFNLDGKLLIGGTEKNVLLLFDPLNNQLIKELYRSNQENINHVKFLNSNLFASCSSDKKITIYDIRNLKYKFKILKDGHTNLIKNVEYDSNLKYLVSSSFDGTINVWDLFNSSDQTESDFVRMRPQDCPLKKVLLFNPNCLMRMRLTNDQTKMIVCTAEGYIMIVHDLNLNTLKEDLNEFKSDLYRLMQKKHSPGIDFGSWRNNLFINKRNRVELISDFPTENEAHLIGSLDVHPNDWSILSRNLSRDENSEWTCVHNIQDYERPNEMMDIEMPKTDNIYFPIFRESSTSRDYQQSDNLRLNNVASSNAQSNRVPISSRSINDESNPLDLHISPLIIISTVVRSSRRAQATILNPNISYRVIKPASRPPKIFCNLNRMTHYLEEPNDYKILFKESHFSSCGRFIVSPCNFGFRLLSFNSECTELSDQMLSDQFVAPQKLNEIRTFLNHSNYVTTVRFSPTYHQIASCCLNGQINFYQPVL